MKINRKFPCEFIGGKPVLDDPHEFTKAVKKMEGKKGYITVMPFRKMKTNEQNKYYRGVVVQRLADYWGYTNEEAHQAISTEHLKVTIHDGVPPIIKSTALSEWNTEEWEQYMTFLRNWASSEFGVYIEEPNEVDMSSIPDVYH